MKTVVSDTFISLNGPVWAGNSLLHDAIARPSAAELVVVGVAVYMLPDLNGHTRPARLSVAIALKATLRRLHSHINVLSHCL